MNRWHRFWLCIAAAVAAVVVAVPAASAGVRKYDTVLDIRKANDPHKAAAPGGLPDRTFVGTVWSPHVRGAGPANFVRKCMNGRRVILFKQRPGADRKLGADRSAGGDPTIESSRSGDWQVSAPKGTLRHGDHVYAKAMRKVANGYVCRPDRSPTINAFL